MRRITAPALLAVLAFTVAGCGGTNKGDAVSVVRSGSATATYRLIIAGTLTIPNVATGTLIRCKGWRGKYVSVPHRGSGLEVGESVKLSGTMKETELMSLTHRKNGAITVACQLVEPR